MTLSEYFELIQEKIKNKDIIIIEINNKVPKEISVFIEAINYMMYEWCEDHKDDRITVFVYIIKPNDVDYDFTTLSFDSFIQFLSEKKSKQVIMVTI